MIRDTHFEIKNISCSVCIATYNGEIYIHKQIKSILDQLSANDEIIISDDGSKDQTIAIIESFNDPRIKIYVNDNGKGPVGNFENALLKSKGDIVFLSDQDDKWFSNKLATHINLHKGYDLVISNAVVVDSQDNVIFQSFFRERGSRAGFINNLIKNSYIGCCMSVNRKVLGYALPFPRHIHMHDWWIGLVAELKGKSYFCDEQLMNYVRHENNASPTLGNSGYSRLRRIRNRLGLLYSLIFVLFK